MILFIMAQTGSPDSADTREVGVCYDYITAGAIIGREAERLSALGAEGVRLEAVQLPCGV